MRLGAGTKGGVGLALAACLGACATAPDTSVLDILAPPNRVVGSPTDLYTRLARGAMTCWFGPAGPLKTDYLYHAEAEPPSRGGRSEIVVHVREKDAAAPKGVRAFTIVVEPKGEAAELSVANLKIPEPLGAALIADVDRWAAGELSCSGTVSATWTPVEDAPAVKPEGSAQSNKAPERKKR